MSNEVDTHSPKQSPAQRLQEWLDEAKQHPHIKEPTAMSLATANTRSEPSVRTVLLKELDEKGLVFYTNNESQKGQELIINPHVCVNFFWMPMMRQVRVSGRVEAVQSARSDNYFHSRRRESQIGAHASHQSKPLESYETLMERYHALTEEFEGKEIPRPAYWGGWRILPNKFEFWHEGDHRLHRREIYTKKPSGWVQSMLNP